MKYTILQQKRIIELQINGSPRIFQLKCPDIKTFQGWIDHIKYSINTSIGRKKNISLLNYRFSAEVVSQFKFWRFLHILEDVFLDQVQTGDIVLCSNKKRFSLQQMGTPSHIDRVYILLKLNEVNNQAIGAAQDRVYVLRLSAEQRSIILDKWSDFKKHCEGKYADLIYRSLYTPRTPQFT